MRQVARYGITHVTCTKVEDILCTDVLYKSGTCGYISPCKRDGVFYAMGTKFPMIRRRGFYGHDILHQGRDSGDPGTGSGHQSRIWKCSCIPNFKAILRYRVAHNVYLKSIISWARWVSQRAVRKTGIEIHPGATIGRGLLSTTEAA